MTSATPDPIAPGATNTVNKLAVVTKATAIDE
jgi:hypothetical protein